MTARDEERFQKLKKAEATTADKFMARLRNLGWVKDAGRTLYYLLQDLMLGNILAPNAALHNRHKDERCVIMLTGPSVDDIDVRCLASEVTICCNLAYMHPDFAAMKPTYHALVEPYYGLLMGKKHIEDMTFLFRQVNEGLAGSDVHLFLSGSVRSLVRRHGFFAGKDISYILPGERLLSAQQLTNDLTRRISFADGVVYASIAAAMYMGCREIYLLGAGYTYKPVYEKHFYDYISVPAHLPEHEREKEMQRLKQQYPTVEFVHMHRRGDEFMITAVSHREDDFYEGYRIVRDFAAERGVRIINVIPEGFASPVFDSISSEAFMQDMTGVAHRGRQ